jgi:L-threonylcarbamoyladenylate synthase
MIGTDIQLAKELLDKGEIVAIPTETVYGLAADATNEKAIVKIFEAKNRPFFDPLISHFRDLDMVKEWVPNIPEKALELAKQFWPGSLTLILPKSARIPDIVTSGLNTMAVRVPKHSLTHSLLSKLDYPLAAPSANPFGYISPTTAAHVDEQLGSKIEYILDGGKCRIGLESTIISFANPLKTRLLRHGGIARETLEAIIGGVDVELNSGSNPEAPGQLKRHYSPKTKFVLSANVDAELHKLSSKETKIGVLRFQKDLQKKDHEYLCEAGDLSEAASNLFSKLRAMDELGYDLIIAEKAPEMGLGLAINDRLNRASS